MTSIQDSSSYVKAQTQHSDTDPRSKRFYHPEIDILRFFAFIMVFFHHALPQDAQTYLHAGLSKEVSAWASSIVLSGGLGVDLFFVLSSFLITELFIREYNKYGRVNVLAFYIRRALRIWPLYYGFLVLVIFLIPVSISGDLDGRYKATFTLFAANWACTLWGYPPSIAAHLWSVSIEEQFYFMWPLIIIVFGIKRISQVAVTMLVLATATRLFLILIEVKHPGIWCNTFARLDPIASGALLAVILRGDSPRISSLKRVALFLVGITLLVVASRYAQPWGTSSLLFYPATALGSILVLISCLSRAYVNKNYLSKTLIYLGRISYGLYVFHLLALVIVSKIFTTGHMSFNLVGKCTFGLILTLLISVGSYELFEKYFLRLKERFSRIPSRPT